MQVAWEKGCYSSALPPVGAASTGTMVAVPAKHGGGGSVETKKKGQKKRREGGSEDEDEVAKFWSGINHDFSLFKSAQDGARRRGGVGGNGDTAPAPPAMSMMVHEHCLEYIEHKRKAYTESYGTRVSRFEALRVALLR